MNQSLTGGVSSGSLLHRKVTIVNEYFRKASGNDFDYSYHKEIIFKVIDILTALI